MTSAECFPGLSREEQATNFFEAFAGIQTDVPVPQTNLLYDLRAGVGITASGGAISSWAPQGGSVTAPSTQPTSANRPKDALDEDGNPSIVFDVNSLATPHHFLLPAGISVGTQAFSVWAVVEVTHYTQSPIISLTGWTYILGAMSAGVTPMRVSGNGVQGTINIPINKGIVGCVSGPSATVFHNHATSQTIGAAGASSGTGGAIGLWSGNAFIGRIYRILIYGATQSAGDVAATKAALIQNHGIVTSYPNRLVCVGDSLTYGAGMTLNRNWPYRLGAMKQTWEVFNLGISGATISAMTPNIPTNVTPLFDAGKRCELILWGGRNDVGGGASAATTFSRIQAFCNAAKSGAAWNGVNVVTLIDCNDFAAVADPANVTIRGGDSSYDHVIDLGRGSVLETRLSDGSDLNYFQADTVHPSDGGGQVAADFIAGDIP